MMAQLRRYPTESISNRAASRIARKNRCGKNAPVSGIVPACDTALSLAAKPTNTVADKKCNFQHIHLEARKIE